MEPTADAVALGLVWYAAFLFSSTVHEASRALAALRLGDETACLGGQVTLNPLPHFWREPFGTVLVPLLSYVLAGWVMGHRGAAVTSEAGRFTFPRPASRRPGSGPGLEAT